MGDYVKNPDLQHLLGSLWGYYGLPPSKLSGFYYANATGGYLKNGSYYIKQRSQDLSDAMVEAIDLVPTLLDAVGIEIPAAVQGQSLHAICTGDADPDFHRPADYAATAGRSARWLSGA